MKSTVTVILPVAESLWVHELNSHADVYEGIEDECKSRGWNVQTTDEAMGKVISPCDELSKLVAEIINRDWPMWTHDPAIMFPSKFRRALELLAAYGIDDDSIIGALNEISDEMELSANSEVVKRDIVSY